MRKPTKPKTRPATWVERQSFRHQISKAIDSALQNRIARMTTIPFESPLLNEMFNTPDFKNVGADVADDLGIAREDHTRRNQLMETVKARLAGNRMSYGTGLDSATESALADAGYGDSGFDSDPGWADSALSYLLPRNQIGDF